MRAEEEAGKDPGRRGGAADDGDVSSAKVINKTRGALARDETRRMRRRGRVGGGKGQTTNMG